MLAAVAAVAAQPAVARTTPDVAPPSPEDAPIAYLLDLTSGQVLLAREADRRFMPASITKVMTTFLAFEWMEEGKLLPQQTFTVRPETWSDWNNRGSTMFLSNRARVTVDDLVHGVTTVSANDGAAVLADSAAGSIEDWVEAMNAKAREIGMKDSHFGTPNGWMDEGATFVTAVDLATLASAMLRRHPSKYNHFVGKTEFTYNGITQPNHDPISGSVRGADGIKTGFTNQAGYGFLGSAERNGRRLVMVVAASPRGRTRDRASRDLLEWGFSQFEQRRLFVPGSKVTDAEVQGGSSTQVGLIAPRGVYLSLPRDQQNDATFRIEYSGPLRAPIRQGEEVAHLVVTIEGMPEARVPLEAETDVDEAGVFGRIVNGIRGWLP